MVDWVELFRILVVITFTLLLSLNLLVMFIRLGQIRNRKLRPSIILRRDIWFFIGLGTPIAGGFLLGIVAPELLDDLWWVLLSRSMALFGMVYWTYVEWKILRVDWRWFVRLLRRKDT